MSVPRARRALACLAKALEKGAAGREAHWVTQLLSMCRTSLTDVLTQFQSISKIIGVNF